MTITIIETDPKLTQMSELADRDIKIIIIPSVQKINSRKV